MKSSAASNLECINYAPKNPKRLCSSIKSLFHSSQTEEIFFINTYSLDGAEFSASGLKIGRFPVQISPKTNFSIMTKLPVKSTGK